MPTDHTNGLDTFSMHASDRRRGGPGLALEQVVTPPDLDPETSARRYLREALDSPEVPALTAPEAGSTFRTIGTETVPLTGTKTVKFRQTLHDIPVYGSLVTVELDDDNHLVGIDSALGHPSDVNPVADVSPAQALQAAQQADDGYDPDLDGIVPRLHFYFDRAEAWRLAYIVEDVPVRQRSRRTRTDELEPPHFVDYVVDAHSGDVVAVLPRTPSVTLEHAEPDLSHCDVPADEPDQPDQPDQPEDGLQSGVDSFGEVRTFVAVREEGILVLKDPTHNVETYDFGFADPVVRDRDLPGVVIGNPPAWTPAAVSSHANAVVVSEYLRTVLMRDNIDNRGGALISSINCVVGSSSGGQREWRNAFWNSRQMVYGQVLRDGELVSLSANVDVVAHEIFHGVTEHTARLEYAFQPGALNESYSDIVGTLIANQGNDDPRTWDWELGERLLPGDEAFRDLSNPERFGQPAHMDDFQVLPDTREGDWGGVHINSGIHNFAAYHLLTDEHDDGSLVFTPAEVAALFYLALTQRLSRTSQFTDSRRAVVASGRTLFRRESAADLEAKIAAIEKAFDAVGIS